MRTKSEREIAEMTVESVYAALQAAKPNAVLVSLPCSDGEDLIMFSGNLKAAVLCNVSLPVFFVTDQPTGELVTWGECSSLAQALEAVFDAIQIFSSGGCKTNLA